MEKMLINTSHPEELRVALVKDQTLYDLDIEKPGQILRKKGNIYKGKIARLEPSLEAAFIDYGSDRQGFLPLKEISPEYFRTQAPKEGVKPGIRDLVSEGQEILIQIEKEERGNKGAALTTFLTLAGCYLVLMSNNPRSGGISRRIEGEEREELKDMLRNLNIPDKMGVIIRTAGLGKSLEDLQWDLDVLVHQFNNIKQASGELQPPQLIHEEGDIIIRSLRDNLRRNVEEIILDNPETYIKAKNYIQQIKPSFVNNVKLYQDPVPLFNRYQIEHQIETAYKREVTLPAGGSIIIDRTEALVSIDINSARATGGVDIETTALNTNCEAAVEIARQLRLRDLGGLIVIDFIDMSASKNQREVENRLREALRTDRARVQVGRISRFGLLEMSRQRLRLSLGETSQQVCPHCDGRGTIRSIESIALSIVRLIEESALQPQTKTVQVQLPLSVATFLMNEKRNSVHEIEARHHCDIIIIPNPQLEVPHYHIKRLKTQGGGGKGQRSFDLVESEQPKIPQRSAEPTKQNQPAISPVPMLERKTNSEGLVKRLWQALFGSTAEVKPAEKSTQRKPQQQRRRQGQQGSQSRGGGRGGQGQRGGRRHPQRGRGQQGGQRSQQNRGNTSGNRQQQAKPQSDQQKQAQQQKPQQQQQQKTQQQQQNKPQQQAAKPAQQQPKEQAVKQNPPDKPTTTEKEKS